MSIPRIEYYPAYTTCPKPFGVVYEGRNKKKKFMRGDEVYKFYDGTLTYVGDQLVNLLKMNQVEKKYHSMSSLVILISADSVDESVSSSTSLIILSDTATYLSVVPAIIPEITLEVEAAIVDSPAGVLDLVVHSDLETEPSEAPLSRPIQAIPTPAHIIPAPPTIPYRPSVLV
ncbi:hypothetical protein Tco_1315241 [Tanacetum coccineum]